MHFQADANEAINSGSKGHDGLNGTCGRSESLRQTGSGRPEKRTSCYGNLVTTRRCGRSISVLAWSEPRSVLRGKTAGDLSKYSSRFSINYFAAAVPDARPIKSTGPPSPSGMAMIRPFTTRSVRARLIPGIERPGAIDTAFGSLIR